MRKIDTVALIGLGAIGSFFADKMQTVLGDNLRIIADGDRAQRLKKEGMIINGKQKYFNIIAPGKVDDYADLVIVIPKMAGLKQALEDVKGQVGPDTIIMTPLNGVESEEVAASVYGKESVIYSLMRVSSVKDGNHVTFDSGTAYMEFGERMNDPNHLSEKVQSIKELMERVNIKSVIRADMLLAIWEKYVCNVSENQVSAVLDIPFGAWGSCEAANELRVMAADEVIRIARAKGIMIDWDYARKHLEHLKKVSVSNKSSTLQDILAGRKTEKDIFAGTVMRLGKETGVSTPINQFLYDALTVLEAKNDGRIVGI